MSELDLLMKLRKERDDKFKSDAAEILEGKETYQEQGAALMEAIMSGKLTLKRDDELLKEAGAKLPEIKLK